MLLSLTTGTWLSIFQKIRSEESTNSKPAGEHCYVCMQLVMCGQHFSACHDMFLSRDKITILATGTQELSNVSGIKLLS